MVLLIQIPSSKLLPILALFGYVGVGLITHLVTKKRSTPKLTLASLAVHLIAITSLAIRHPVLFKLSFDVRRYEPFMTSSLILFALVVITNAIAVKRDSSYKKLLISLTLYLVGFTIIFPNSFIVYILALITLIFATEFNGKKRFILSFVSVLSFTVLIVGIGRIAYSDIIFNKSLKVNDLFKRREMQYQALSLDSANERHHVLFANTNILIAHQLREKQDPIALVAQRGGLTNQNRLTISIAVKTAILEGQKLIILNPQDSANWFYLGKIYQSLQTFIQGADYWAIASFQKAAELDSQNVRYYFEIGKTYYGTGDFNKAVPYFTKALTLNSKDKELLYYLGWTYYRLQNLPKAINSMKQALPRQDAKQALVQFEKQLRK